MNYDSRRLPAANAKRATTNRNRSPRSHLRLEPKYQFIPPTLAGARIHRVLAVLGGQVIVEFAFGTLRVQTSLKVPDDELADFLLDCERQCGLKGLMARPAFISGSVPQAQDVRRLLSGD